VLDLVCHLLCGYHVQQDYLCASVTIFALPLSFFLSLSLSLSLSHSLIHTQTQTRSPLSQCMSLSPFNSLLPPLLTGMGGSVQVKVHRDTLVEDAFLGLRQAGSRLKGRVQVEFIGEAGIDGGGLFKEFIDSFLKAAFNPSLGLFCPTSEQLLVPNPLSSQNAETIAFATSDREGAYFFSPTSNSHPLQRLSIA
jgi:hypothetical protein